MQVLLSLSSSYIRDDKSKDVARKGDDTFNQAVFFIPIVVRGGNKNHITVHQLWYKDAQNRCSVV